MPGHKVAKQKAFVSFTRLARIPVEMTVIVHLLTERMRRLAGASVQLFFTVPELGTELVPIGSYDVVARVVVAAFFVVIA